MRRRRQSSYVIEKLENRWLLSAGPALAAEGTVEVEVLPGQLAGGSYASIPNLGNQGGAFSAVGGNITVGPVEDADGFTYQSLEFNGSNSATSSFLTPSDLTGNASRSIEIWVDNPTIDNDEETMVSWSHRGGPDGTNESFSYGSTYGVGLWGPEYDIQWTQGAPGVDNSGAPAANNWHYLVFTYDGSNEDVYVDGSLYLQNTTDLALDTTGGLPINLAAQNTAASGFSAALNGSLDIAALRISAGALTAADVENNFIAGVPGRPQATAAPTTSPTLNPITSAGENKLTWTYDPNATSYDVFRTDPSDPTPLEIASNLLSLTYTDSAISPGVNYTYFVESANAYGAGPASNTESRTVNALTTAPTLYPLLSASDTVTLSWSIDPNAVSYNLYRYTAPDPTPVEVVSGLTSNSYIDSTVVDGSTYTYYVISVNAVSTGPESNTETASPTAPGPAAPVNILTHHADAQNDGNNAQETVLTPANVNPTDFGKEFADALDGGDVIAEPLYEQNVDITTGPYAGIHSVVIAATEADGLYALDANTGVVLWHDNFTNITDPTNLTPTAGVTTILQSDIAGNPDVGSQLGILATPAIDPNTGIIYLNANTKEIRSDGTHFVQRLWAIHIENGESAMSPAVIGDTIAPDGLQEGPPAGPYTYVAGPIVDGTGNNDPTTPQPTYPDTDGWTAAPGGATGYVIAFNAIEQMERTAVSLINGAVYLGFASHGDDGPYYGWVLGYSAATLQLTAAFVTTPTYEPATVVGESQPYNQLGGIWMSGANISTDGTYLYLATGNGAFNGEPSNFVNSDGFPLDNDYGDSVLKLEVDPSSSPTNQNGNGWGLKVADYFTPSNQLALNDDDLDLGSGGVTVLPDNILDAAGNPMLLAGGKESRVYLIDRNDMGKYNYNYPLDGSNPDPSTYDHVVGEYANDGLDNGNEQLYTSATYYNGNVYLGVSTSSAIELNIDQLMNGSVSPIVTDYGFGYPADTFDISDDAGSNAVAWVLDPGSAALLAFNPASFSSAPLFNSNIVSGDGLDGVIHFHVPTVANGMVYAGSRGGGLSFYGLRTSYLLSDPAYFSAPTNLTATYVSSGDVHLSWTSNSSLATEFRVDRAPAGTTDWSTLAYVNNSNNTYDDTIAGSFVYRVVAVSGTNSTAPSNSATVATAPWQSLDIGSPAIAGSASDNNGVYTVTGSGSHIGSNSDQFQFDYQAVTGPASIVASLSTPVVATDGTQPFLAQGGVMFRSSGSADASFVEVVYINGLGVQMLYRNGDGTAAAEIGSNSNNGPLYVRLDRTGSTFTGYYSSNGTNWTLIGSIFDPAIGSTAAVGLVACSHDNSRLVDVAFNNVSITEASALPAPWQSLDIGSPAIAGNTSYNNGVYTVTGSGSDIGSNTDQFQFDYQAVTGPASIVASLPTPVVAADGTQPSGAQGGVMFRSSINADVPFVEVVYSDALGIQMLYRNGYGAMAAQVGSNISYSGPLYVRLVRTGGTYAGYYSSNGTNWTLIGSIFNPAIGTTALVGLVACSDDNSRLVNVVYNNVTITPLALLNGSTLDVNLSSAGPVTVSTSGGTTTVSEGFAELAFAASSFSAIQVTER
jgi:hypothetical protein